jgi:branched-chain amino acid transport system permease protein
VLLEQVVSGLASGSLYGLFALALVMIYRGTDVVNFAQGEMAMITVFVALTLIKAGMSFWGAFALTLAFAALLGAAAERLVIRYVSQGAVLNLVIATVGLFTVCNSLAGWIWGYIPEPFPTPLEGGAPLRLGGLVVTRYTLVILGVAVAIMGLLYAFFSLTTLGIAMRAVAQNRTASRLMGIPVNRMLLRSWALSSMLGAIAGLLVAPLTYVDPNAMSGLLVYAFASAVLGGLDSPVGAVIGGLIVGVVENLAGAYLGSELKLTFAFVLIVGVLVLRPAGLFGRAHLKKV